MSPRRLADNTGYHAFVIPTFETGRLAGIGQDPRSRRSRRPRRGRPPTAASPEDLEHPIYLPRGISARHRGDFEYLVRPADAGAGRPSRRHPRHGRTGSRIEPSGTEAPLGGILQLGGALRVPVEDLDETQLAQRTAFEDWDQPYPNAFEQSLAAFVNLPDDYAAQTAGDANSSSGLPTGIGDDPDPLITAPLYGRWQSLTQRLLTERDGTPAPNTANWVHRLNLDPRFRVPPASAPTSSRATPRST